MRFSPLMEVSMKHDTEHIIKYEYNTFEPTSFNLFLLRASLIFIIYYNYA